MVLGAADILLLVLGQEASQIQSPPILFLRLCGTAGARART